MAEQPGRWILGIRQGRAGKRDLEVAERAIGLQRQARSFGAIGKPGAVGLFGDSSGCPALVLLPLLYDHYLL